MKIERMASLLGMKETQGVFEGAYYGYTFHLIHYYTDAITKILALQFVFDHQLTKDEFKAISKAHGAPIARLESVALNQNAVVLPMLYKSTKPEKIEAYMTKITAAMSALDLKNLIHCPFCGNEDTDAKRVVKGSLVHVHEQCAKDFYEKIIERVEAEEKSVANLPKSLLFALFGAVVGLIPTFISALFFNYMLAILYALIPLGAFYGFKKGGAAKNGYVPYLIAGISLVVSLLFIVWLYNTGAAGLGMTFSEMLEVPENRTEFFGDLGTSALFTGIGVLIVWKNMSKQTNAQLKKDLSGLKK
ncbi:MAG: hypothetical protein C4537_04585 [Acholeplasma sp.]|nr:MAG: hypothetical protein C4537_04585 [Acholeplasma sp.]